MTADNLLVITRDLLRSCFALTLIEMHPKPFDSAQGTVNN